MPIFEANISDQRDEISRCFAHINPINRQTKEYEKKGAFHLFETPLSFLSILFFLIDLSVNSISNYYYPQDSDFQFIKIGGEPRFIQPKYYYVEKLEEDGYSFYLQIDEEGYRDGMGCVFMYGALYLYKHNVTGEIIAGFWQCS